MRWKKSRRFVAIALALIVAQSTVMTTAISSYAYTTDKVESKQYGYLEPGETVSGQLTDTISYTLDSSGTLTITGTGEIPDYMGSYDLPWYEYNYSITNVYVSEGITRIGDNTFNGLGGMPYSSVNVSLPSTLKSLGSRAFASSGISSLNLPSTLDSIGDYCFEGAYINSTITLEQVNSIGYMAFNGYIYSIFMPCTFDFSLFTNAGMEVVDYGVGKELRCGYGSIRLELIHQGTILSGKLTDTINYTLDCEGYLSITGKGEMPNYSSCSQTPWGSYVGKDFIKYISIGEGITRIGNNSFNGLSDLSSNMPGSMYDPMYGTSNSQQTYINVGMPNTLKSIGDYAFANDCLEYIWLPGNLEEIGSECFSYSTFGSSGIMGSAGGMLSITSDVRIGGSAFFGCTLSYLELPCTMTNADFMGSGIEIYGIDCYNKYFMISGSMSTNMGYIHYNHQKGEGQDIVISGSLTDTIDYSLTCDGTLTITGTGEMPDFCSMYGYPSPSYMMGTSNISSAPWGMYTAEIKRVVIGEGITKIGEYTFVGLGQQYLGGYAPSYGDTVSIDIANSIETMGNYAFEECYISYLKLPSKLKAVDSYTFYNCKMSTIDAPCTVNSGILNTIRNMVFSEMCSPAIMVIHEKGYGEEVVISGKVTDTIDYELTCDGTLTITGTGEMPDYESIENYPYPSNMVGISKTSTAPWGNYVFDINNVVIGDGITKIGSHSFVSLGMQSLGNYHNNSISGVGFDIADSVETIGDYAFENSEIPYLSLPCKIKSITSQFAYGCMIENIEIPCTMDKEVIYNTGLNNYCPSGATPTITIKHEKGEGEDVVISGKVTDTIDYKLTCDGALTITGEGEMPDYEMTYDIGMETSNAPWGKYALDIKSVVIGEGITKIGSNSFVSLGRTNDGTTDKAISFDIANSVKEIDEKFACYCVIKNIDLPYVVAKNPAFSDLLDSGMILVDKINYKNYNEKDTLISGKVTDTINYNLTCDGTLTITGTGEMPNYESITNYPSYPSSMISISPISTAPWGSYAREINKVVIGEGITKIGDYSFISLGNNITDVYGNPYICSNGVGFDIADSVKVISRECLLYCTVVSMEVPCTIDKESLYKALEHNSTILEELLITYKHEKGEGEDVVSSGKVTDTINYQLTCDGTLTITGTGEIPDYGSKYSDNKYSYHTTLIQTSTAPWGSYVAEINKVVIGEGITKIGDYSFVGLGNNITDVYGNPYICSNGVGFDIADSVTTIGSCAFANCNITQQLILPSGLSSIGERAFEYCLINGISIHRTFNKELFQNTGVILNEDKSCFTLNNSDSWQEFVYYGVEPEKDELSISSSALTLDVGAYYRLTAKAKLEENPKIVWSSSDKNIATVSETGNVKGISSGTATVTATTESGLTATCVVTVPKVSDTEPTTVALSLTELTLEKDNRYRLTPTLNPTDSRTTYTWSSSDESVATVSATGNVLAVGSGTATITVTTKNGLTATCKVTVPKVNDAEPTAVALNLKELTLEKDNRYRLTPILNPTDSRTTYTWSSSDESVATVSETGNVLAVGSGTATITVTTKNGLTATCVVTVPKVSDTEPTAVALSLTEMTLEKDNRYRLIPTLNPTDSRTTYTWSSSDESVATVSETGNVLAVGSGTATITVTTKNGLTATCVVTVPEPSTVVATEVTLSASKIYLKAGNRYRLTPTLDPADAKTSYTWSSSDESVATVSETGNVLAVGSGTATITVTTKEGLTATCTVVVNNN